MAKENIMLPFFSIIIPSYNRANSINIAIDSVLEQTYLDWELLIVDDGSTDNTKEVVKGYQDERIRYIYQENAERSAARNNGVNHSKGEYICFLDSDDFLDTNFLQSLFERVRETNYPIAVFGTTRRYIKNDIQVYKELIPLDDESNLPSLIKKGAVIPTDQCAHRKILQSILFDERLSLWEDTHLWFRVLEKYPVYGVEKAIIYAQEHQGSSVVAGFQHVKTRDVERYIMAVKDCFSKISPKYKYLLSNYIDIKYRMYLYQARINKQVFVALKIWLMAIYNKPSFYLFTELLKIPISFLKYYGR